MSYSLTLEQAEAILSVWNCAGVTIRFEIVGTIFCLRRESQDDNTGTFYIGYPGKDQVALEADRVGIVRRQNERPHLVIWLVPSFCIDFNLDGDD